MYSFVTRCASVKLQLSFIPVFALALVQACLGLLRITGENIASDGGGAVMTAPAHHTVTLVSCIGNTITAPGVHVADLAF